MLKIRLALFVAICLSLIAGCSGGGNPQAPARISGQVTYNGTAVPAGTIVFHSEDKGSYPAPITDGRYEVTDVPTGDLKVTVETESVNPAKKKPDYAGGKGAKDYAERLAAEGNTAAGFDVRALRFQLG